MTAPLSELTHGRADWAGLRVVVAGIGVSGFAAADALLERGALVVVAERRTTDATRERGIVLDTLGATILLGPDATGSLPDVDGAQPDLVVASPTWSPDQPLLAQAAGAGIPIWGEAELAWRMRPLSGAAPWLTVAGTSGKSTTVTMLESMLRAAGHRAIATGLDGTSLLEAVLHPQPYDVIAVELSSFQLRWSSSLQPLASVCLNSAPDHLGWHGSLEAYRLAEGRVYQDTEIACVYNVADPVTEDLVREADVIEGCRAIGFTLGVPGLSMLGLVEDVLCDRAFVPERQTSAAELGTLDDVREGGGGVLAPHTVSNALAAAALARAYGVPAAAVRNGLRACRPLPHRLTTVAAVDDVSYVDDAAATSPHAASAGLAAFEHVVWIAGRAGAVLDPGAGLDDLVTAHAKRLRGVVLTGTDAAQREVIRAALERHAPDVPVAEVGVAETGSVPVMEIEVAQAAQLAQPGDTVLLAPACAALDPFENDGARGDAFAAAVRLLGSA